jgi:ATP-dependent Clp protease ATP-binding subunit ClpA
VAGLLTEPNGIAARIIQKAGLTGDQVVAAVGAGPATRAENVDPAALQALRFGPEGKAALTSTLKAALRLGHNYIGTEHMLLGVLFAPGPTSDALKSLGLDTETVERLVATELAGV